MGKRGVQSLLESHIGDTKWLCKDTLPKTLQNSANWETILSFWGPAYFQIFFWEVYHNPTPERLNIWCHGFFVSGNQGLGPVKNASNDDFVGVWGILSKRLTIIARKERNTKRYGVQRCKACIITGVLPPFPIFPNAVDTPHHLALRKQDTSLNNWQVGFCWNCSEERLSVFQFLLLKI